MEQTNTTGGGMDRDKHGLCLLSLGEVVSLAISQLILTVYSTDGGGVRGLSTLYILQGLMKKVNSERAKVGLATVKPCEVFDLIGGTSTGG
jgi:hypothetical protein